MALLSVGTLSVGSAGDHYSKSPQVPKSLRVLATPHPGTPSGPPPIREHPHHRIDDGAAVYSCCLGSATRPLCYLMGTLWRHTWYPFAALSFQFFLGVRLFGWTGIGDQLPMPGLAFVLLCCILVMGNLRGHKGSRGLCRG